MSDFQVTLRVSAARLATVLEALAGAAQLVSVLPCVADNAEVPSKPPRGYRNGKRDKGISGQKLAMQAFQKAANGSLTTKQLGRLFAAQGFSTNSASPALAALAKEGLVERIELGRWKLTEKGRTR